MHQSLHAHHDSLPDRTVQGDARRVASATLLGRQGGYETLNIILQQMNGTEGRRGEDRAAEPDGEGNEKIDLEFKRVNEASVLLLTMPKGPPRYAKDGDRESRRRSGIGFSPFISSLPP